MFVLTLKIGKDTKEEALAWAIDHILQDREEVHMGEWQKDVVMFEDGDGFTVAKLEDLPYLPVTVEDVKYDGETFVKDGETYKTFEDLVAAHPETEKIHDEVCWR